MIERWLPVVGYEGLYEVSDTGNVRSLHRSVTRIGRGPGVRVIPGAALRPGRSASGYMSVVLHRDSIRKTYNVHHLLLTAFAGPKGPKQIARHLDGDKSHNVLPNLVWGTYRENAIDTSRHNNRKIKQDIISAVRNVDGRQKDLAFFFGLSKTHVSRIKRGEERIEY